ncbi:MAG: hypothetical protein Q7V58_09510 [Actinomycetota bacterium]|nr:hypothetical protein [Actinomycetota bacterium]
MPAPKKDPSLRARSNRATTAGTLDPSAKAAKPALPALFDEDGNELPWHAQAVAFWDDYWDSPMAAKLYSKVDRHRLFIVVDLIHRYWSGDKSLASEIRLACKPFGTTPEERRSNEWDEPANDPAGKPKGRPAPSQAGVRQGRKKADPRLTLVS